MEDDRPISVRLTADLKRGLRKEAERNHRSMNGEINVAILEHLARATVKRATGRED